MIFIRSRNSQQQLRLHLIYDLIANDAAELELQIILLIAMLTLFLRSLKEIYNCMNENINHIHNSIQIVGITKA
jgi:hypothetical protein